MKRVKQNKGRVERGRDRAETGDLKSLYSQVRRNAREEGRGEEDDCSAQNEGGFAVTRGARGRLFCSE